MQLNWLFQLLIINTFTVLIGAVLFATSVSANDKVTYDDHLKPLFQKRCASCHNGDRQSGGLDLTNYTNMMQGGGSGGSIEAGDADGSYLYQLVTHQETPVMPPGNNKLPEQDLKLIETWINGGALENKGSIARTKKMTIVSSGVAGVRPAEIALPPRLSLEPFFHSEQKGIATSIDSSPWAAVVAVAAPRQLLLFEGEGMQFSGTLPFPKGQANVVRFSANGSLLIAGGGRHGVSGKVVGWDVKTCERVFEVGDEFDNVLAADINPEHSMVALGGPQKMLRVYSTSVGKLLYEVKKHNDWMTAIAFSPDSVLLASADRSGGLQLWEADTGNEYLTLAGHDRPITGLSWRPDGNVLSSCSEDGTVKLWEVTNGRQTKSWKAHEDGVSDIEFTRAGKLVTCGRGGLAKQWQQDGKLVRQFEGLSELGVAVAYDDETEQLIGSSLSGEILVWTAKDDKQPPRKLSINPPKLAQRIANAIEHLESMNEELQSFEKQFNKANADFVACNLKTNQISGYADSLNQEIVSREKAAEEFTITSNAVASELESWSAELRAVKKSIPIMNSATEQAAEAASLLPDDSALQELALQVSEQRDKLVKQASDLVERIAKSQDEAKNQGEIAKRIESDLEDLVSRQQDVAIELKQIQDLIGPAKKKKEQLMTQLSTARKNVERAKTRLQKWRSELEFHDLLAKRKQELKAARQLTDSQQDRLLDAEVEFKRTKAAYEKARKRREELMREQENVESIIRRLKLRK